MEAPKPPRLLMLVSAEVPAGGNVAVVAELRNDGVWETPPLAVLAGFDEAGRQRKEIGTLPSGLARRAVFNFRVPEPGTRVLEIMLGPLDGSGRTAWAGHLPVGVRSTVGGGDIHLNVSGVSHGEGDKQGLGSAHEVRMDFEGLDRAVKAARAAVGGSAELVPMEIELEAMDPKVWASLCPPIREDPGPSPPTPPEPTPPPAPTPPSPAAGPMRSPAAGDSSLERAAASSHRGTSMALASVAVVLVVGLLGLLFLKECRSFFPAEGTEVPAEAPADPVAVPDPPEPPENLELVLGRSEYRHGDALDLRVEVPRDGYLYAFSVFADGQVYLLHPHEREPDPRVRAGRTVFIPGDGEPVTMHFPEGVRGRDEVFEHFFAILAPRPLADVAIDSQKDQAATLVGRGWLDNAELYTTRGGRRARPLTLDLPKGGGFASESVVYRMKR